MSDKKIFKSKKPYSLECGAVLREVTIAYHTYGQLNSDKSNCIWVCHALTANSDVADWWPHTVETGKFLDPDKYFIVCANIIGSCYGSTGPLSINPADGLPWFDSFPSLTIRDMAGCHQLLAEHLGINKITALIGSSVGGFQAIEWAVTEPSRFRSLILIATDAYASPWTIASDETQRMAILADKTYGQRHARAAADGLAAARAIGMLTYRGPSGYNASQQDYAQPETPHSVHRAATYQRHQGDKLTRRFDAYSYVTILNAFDTHNVGRGRGGIDNALSTLSMPALIVGITTDIIFTPEEMKNLSKKISHSTYVEIESAFGHDGFLVEHEALNRIITDFYKQNDI